MLPIHLVIPADMGSNIREGSTVPGAQSTDVNHWVAAIFRERFGDYIYPKAAVGQDVGVTAIANSDAYLVTPNYLRLAVAAALASLSDIHLQNIVYNGSARTITVTETNGTTFQVTLPAATTSLDGLVRLSTASQAASAATNDSGAATPALVTALIAAAIAALPPDTDTKVSSFVYNNTTRTLSIVDNFGAAFQSTLPAATNSVYGLVQLAVAGMYPAAATNDVTAATPLYVKTAIADAIAALPGDKFLQGLQSYNPATNVMVLAMNDGSTVSVDMTQLIVDAVASMPTATGSIQGKVALATAVEGPQATNDVDAATPAYVASVVGALVPNLAPLTNAFGVQFGSIIV